ncbi:MULTISPECIES: SDR family oxidoreductase [Planococcus]|uniref:Sugar epimerase n=2 Tax=Planococcus TaxID=1372 RepID=A0ABN4JX74_9BACL|nr:MULTISPECIES: SDR family oxidoreductase [Planococcus]ALS78551.1 sugar epimerase [Planococcus kocurii]AQU79464.1 sugar epimerase [Planococcus faecalis]KAA0956427.1 SDR family oxidoreductase [Planococcus sp. ANT_H30]MDJ0332544.1 SDR family oxidoreductase [Planococcus sp. S3-L1]OHX51431.1 sugar epimerase [Planococcus faecalis]
MKVLVVGANGQIGRQFVKMLADSDKYTPKAMIRKEEQISYFNGLGVESVLSSLEGSVEEITEAMKDCDAVVFAAGSGGKTGADQTLLIDLDGAAKTIEAAEQTGTERFLMISAINADKRQMWKEDMAHYYVAKHHADNILRASGLVYTIIRPGLLTNDAGTGKILAVEDLESGQISREDVARVLLHSLDNEHVFNKTFAIISGEDDIDHALNQL